MSSSSPPSDESPPLPIPASKTFRDSPLYKLLKIVVPRLPLIFRVVTLNLLRISEQSKYLDVKSDLIVQFLRSFLEPSPKEPRTISSIQQLTLSDKGVKGSLWVSKYTAPLPSESEGQNLVQVVWDAIEALQEPGSAKQDANRAAQGPTLDPVEAEWTGYRANVDDKKATLPDITEKAKYEEMLKECTSPLTVLYFHGGAYYLCDPATHRSSNQQLAKASGGKIYSVRYRLSPQNVFPAALFDAFLSYLTLLHPPRDAFHEPIHPGNMVFAGDSAGGNLALALIQLLLQLQRQGTRISIHGSSPFVPPLPAAVAGLSPWLDITQSSPSWSIDTPTPFDYLPKPESLRRAGYHQDEIWPAKPPRSRMYVTDELASHSLVSLVVTKNWEGSPPMWISSGWEILNEEHRFFAKKVARQGVELFFEEWEGMPHCFSLIFGNSDHGKLHTQHCAEFMLAHIRDALPNDQSQDQRRRQLAKIVKGKTFVERETDFESLSTVTEEEMEERVRRAAAYVPEQLVLSPRL